MGEGHTKTEEEERKRNGTGQLERGSEGFPPPIRCHAPDVGEAAPALHACHEVQERGGDQKFQRLLGPFAVRCTAEMAEVWVHEVSTLHALKCLYNPREVGALEHPSARRLLHNHDVATTHGKGQQEGYQPSKKVSFMAWPVGFVAIWILAASAGICRVGKAEGAADRLSPQEALWGQPHGGSDACSGTFSGAHVFIH